MNIIKNVDDIDWQSHIFMNLSSETNQLIKPLKDYFNLDTFNYHKTFFDNSQIFLTNMPNWRRHYIKNKLYQKSIFELTPEKYSKDRIIWSSIDSHDIILTEAAKFNIFHGITIIEPVPDGCEFYFLGTSSNDKTVINKYLSNFCLVEKFIQYFQKVSSPLLKTLYESRLLIVDRQENTLNYEIVNDINRLNFLTTIYGYSFTNRELECIPLLLKSMSAKQIAERLKLSYRTVEIYINNLKTKTGTSNKNDLICLLSEKFY